MKNHLCYTKLAFMVFALFLSTSLLAADVVLVWDPNTESDLAGYKVYVGTGSRTYGAPITVGNTTTYTLPIAAAGTYYIAVTAYNTTGAESGYSNEVTATVSQADTTPPTISSVVAGSITTSGATISWSTNEASDTQVEYGLTPSFGSSTTLNTSLVTSHSQAISGLASGTLYYFRVKSKDAANNLATSANYTFTTAVPADTTPPVISAVAAGSLTTSGATISWTTNEASDTQVEYGLTTGFGSSTALNASLVTSHSQAISGLSGGTQYYFRVKSKDAANNLATSANYTFTTAVVCTPSVSPTIQTFTGTGGSNSVTVTVNSGCPWTAASNAGWMGISTGGSGNGNGTVTYSVAANVTGSTRTGTLTIAGQTVTVSQQAAPSCDVNGDGIINVLDIQVLINVILGTTPNTGNGDLNHDGRVDVLDLQILSNVVLGVTSCP
jgi:hypothetical protein